MRMKQERSQLKIGIVLNYINMGLGNLIPIFYTPVMLALFGHWFGGDQIPDQSKGREGAGGRGTSSRAVYGDFPNNCGCCSPDRYNSNV